MRRAHDLLARRNEDEVGTISLDTWQQLDPWETKRRRRPHQPRPEQPHDGSREGGGKGAKKSSNCGKIPNKHFLVESGHPALAFGK